MNIRWNLSGMEIERESFRVIESECDLHKRMPAPEWRVARRLIHTTADMSIADTLVFGMTPSARVCARYGLGRRYSAIPR